jgi:hypothetical protein
VSVGSQILPPEGPLRRVVPAGPSSGVWVLVAPVVRALINYRLGGALQCVFFPVPSIPITGRDPVGNVVSMTGSPVDPKVPALDSAAVRP